MSTLKKTLAIVLSFVLLLGVLPLTRSNSVNAAETIKLNYTAKELVVGQSFNLKVLTGTKNVTWKTSKGWVATVNYKGVVTAKRAGTAVITATSKTNSKVVAKCTITVLSYKVPELRLVTVNGTWHCGEGLIQQKWKEMYPYLCKYIGEPEKISAQGLTISWDNAVNDPNLVDFKAETNTIYLGPLPHHNNFSPNNHYDYEPFILQIMHEAGHMFNQQGDKLVNFDIGQWIWEAISIVAESEWRADKYGEYNMRQEPCLDLLNLQWRNKVNGVKYDGNKYDRSVVDSSAAAAVYYMSTVLSTPGTTDYWRKVYKLRMDYFKNTGVASLGWDDFATMLDEAAGKRTIDGLKASTWLKNQAVSETNGADGDYLMCYSERPADSWPSFVISCWNRYTDENDVKKEKAYGGTNVSVTVTNAAGKMVANGSYTIPSSGVGMYDSIVPGRSFDSLKLANLTTLKVNATATVNGKKLTSTTYQMYVSGSSTEDYNSTYIMLLDSKGNIKTNVKAADITIYGAATINKKALSRGALVLTAEPGSTYTIKYNGKYYRISQPACRRVYPLKFK